MWNWLGSRQLRAETSDAELHRAALAGSTDAMAALYRRHGGLIYRFTLRMSCDATVAEEITQEVFLALLSQPERFDPERAALPTWLCGIARRQLWKHYEKTGRQSLADDDEELVEPAADDDSPVELLLRSEAVAAVQSAINTLPAELREVIVLCALEEMSYEQTAEAMAVPVGTVRSRLHRAKLRLARALRSDMAGVSERTVLRRRTQ
ncbi:RNA polymerase sigma factor [Acidicapsa dinghuensis]|uniref:RNA polymerase sigma factor n=1 Tax=Acidicapsa dinghuensis TaxID=2218256 RepID=A0ABW1EEU1_9BACT|nr:sigma-70 family RNA polymerase sigma factor [Acidicapsa dinghuensis]